MTTPTTIDPDAFNRFEAQGWERAAQAYDDFFTPITTQVVDELLDAAGAGEGTRLLDVACGPGTAAARAAGRGATATGIDISQSMIDLASRTHLGCSFRQGNAEDLPYASGSFGAAVGNFAILHVGRPERAASELARVLVAGGRAALTVWGTPQRCPLLGLLVDAVTEVGAATPEAIPAGPPFFRYADDAEFANLLRVAGFGEIEVRTLELSHTLTGPDELWDGLLQATVRTSPLVLLQDDDARRQIRDAFDRSARRYTSPAGLVLPVQVKLASGRRTQGGTT